MSAFCKVKDVEKFDPDADPETGIEEKRLLTGTDPPFEGDELTILNVLFELLTF
jgi:hypothetical protein